MSNPHRHLPPEMLDHIVDLLHDDPETLEQCCLVSESWVPRARKHLFARIGFDSASHLGLWKKTFPDPSNSPAHYAHTLIVSCPQAFTEVDAEEGGLIRAFSGASQFVVGSDITSLEDSRMPLALFHTFSPTLKSLRLARLALSCSQVFNLVRSFPLLEDLTLICGDCSLDDDDPHESRTVVPSTSPVFTGVLELLLWNGIKDISHQLLSLSGGIHFRGLTLTCSHVEDPLLTTALVGRCSHTLASLRIGWYLVGTSTQHLYLYR